MDERYSGLGWDAHLCKNECCCVSHVLLLVYNIKFRATTSCAEDFDTLALSACSMSSTNVRQCTIEHAKSPQVRANFSKQTVIQMQAALHAAPKEEKLDCMHAVLPVAAKHSTGRGLSIQSRDLCAASSNKHDDH